MYIYIHIPYNSKHVFHREDDDKTIGFWGVPIVHRKKKKNRIFGPEMDHEMGKDQEVTRCGDFGGQPRQLDG